MPVHFEEDTDAKNYSTFWLTKMTKENEEMVTVVNTVNRRTQSMLKSDAVQFLRKHTLFRLVEKAPIAEPKRKIRKVIKKQGKELIKEESSTLSRCVFFKLFSSHNWY